MLFTYDQTVEKFNQWGDFHFEYEYDLGKSPTYHGLDPNLGIHIYITIEDDYLVGLMATVVQTTSFDATDQAHFLQQMVNFFISYAAFEWMADNWPSELDEKAMKYFETKNGTLIFSIEKDKDIRHTLLIFDINFLQTIE